MGLPNRGQMIRRLRDESVANFGCAAKQVANELLRIRDDVRNTQAGSQRA